MSDESNEYELPQ